MNDRYRNVCKAHDHIVKCRSKEAKKSIHTTMGLLCGYSIRGTNKSKNKKMHVQAKQSKQSIRPMGEELL